MSRENILLSESEKKALAHPEEYKEEIDSNDPESALASARYQARKKAENLPQLAETVLSEINLMRTKLFIDNPENTGLEDDEIKGILKELTEVYADEMVEYTKFYGVEVLEYFVETVLEQQPPKQARELEERLAEKNDEFEDNMRQYLGSLGRRLERSRSLKQRIDELEGWSSRYLLNEEVSEIASRVDYEGCNAGDVDKEELRNALNETLEKEEIQERKKREKRKEAMVEEISSFDYKEFIVEQLLEKGKLSPAELTNLMMIEKGELEEKSSYQSLKESAKASQKRGGYKSKISQSGEALEEAGIIAVENKGKEDEMWCLREEADFLEKFLPTSELHQLWRTRISFVD